jgi:alkaline phosphatase D
MNKYLILLLIAIVHPGHSQNFGDSTHPMNKDTDNRLILNYWTKKSDLINAVYESALKVLSAKPEASFFDLSANTAFQKIAGQDGMKLLGGPMLGNVKESGVSIWVRTLKPSQVSVEVTGQAYSHKFGPVRSTRSTDLSAVLVVDGLKPSSAYTYRLFIDGKPIPTTGDMHFRTAASPDNLEEASRIVFGSCPHRWGLGNPTLLGQIQSHKPDAFLLYGDIAVQDRTNHLGMHRADYLLRDFHPAWKSLTANIPVYATWDDHDYFGNDKSGIPEGFVDKDRDNVREVFKNSWNNPSYGFEDSKQGIFTRTRIGAFDIIMTDNRYFRDNQVFLGKSQLDWLKKELLACTAPFIILSCGSMWSDYVSDGKDSWGENDAEGREELFSFIEKNNISGVLLLSGDRHGARGFRIPRKSGFSYYEFEPGRLGGRVGPPAKQDSWDTQLFGLDGTFAFGELTYLPSTTDPGVAFRLVKEDGSLLYELKLQRSQLTPNNFH